MRCGYYEGWLGLGEGIMKPELLIAIVSGLLTLVASSVVAMLQARVEFRKLAHQLEQKYTTALFDQRLAVYPLLFRTIHDFNHRIEYGIATPQHLIEFQQQFDRWIADHAILLTPHTAQAIWGYHYYLIELLERYPHALHPPTPGDVWPAEVWTEVRNIQVTLDKILRAELGVFDTQAAGTPEFKKPHFRAVLDRLDQSAYKIRRRFET
jgi:hypothetical protein